MKWRFWERKRKSATVLKIVPKVEKPRVKKFIPQEELKETIQKHRCGGCGKNEDEVGLYIMNFFKGDITTRPFFFCNECQWVLIEIIQKQKAKNKMKVVK